MICFDTSILFTSVTECKAESVYGRQYLLTCFICLTFVSPLMFSQSYQPLKRSEAQVSDFLTQTHFSERFFVVGIVVENFWDKDLVPPCYPPSPHALWDPCAMVQCAICYVLYVVFYVLPVKGVLCCAVYCVVSYVLYVVFYVLSVTCALCALVLLMQILRNGLGNLSSMWELWGEHIIEGYLYLPLCLCHSPCTSLPSCLSLCLC